MSVAGVELRDGRRVWAETAAEDVCPLDLVRVRLEDQSEAEGTVFLAPLQVIGTPPSPAVVILSTVDRTARSDDTDLPGADMPPLGMRIDRDGRSWTVAGIDPVQRTITLADADETQTVSLDALPGIHD